MDRAEPRDPADGDIRAWAAIRHLRKRLGVLGRHRMAEHWRRWRKASNSPASAGEEVLDRDVEDLR